jgi:hypothetical protein
LSSRKTPEEAPTIGDAAIFERLGAIFKQLDAGSVAGRTALDYLAVIFYFSTTATLSWVAPSDGYIDGINFDSTQVALGINNSSPSLFNTGSGVAVGQPWGSTATNSLHWIGVKQSFKAGDVIYCRSNPASANIFHMWVALYRDVPS